MLSCHVLDCAVALSQALPPSGLLSLSLWLGFVAISLQHTPLRQELLDRRRGYNCRGSTARATTTKKMAPRRAGPALHAWSRQRKRPTPGDPGRPEEAETLAKKRLRRAACRNALSRIEGVASGSAQQRGLVPVPPRMARHTRTKYGFDRYEPTGPSRRENESASGLVEIRYRKLVVRPGSSTLRNDSSTSHGRGAPRTPGRINQGRRRHRPRRSNPRREAGRVGLGHEAQDPASSAAPSPASALAPGSASSKWQEMSRLEKRHARPGSVRRSGTPSAIVASAVPFEHRFCVTLYGKITWRRPPRNLASTSRAGLAGGQRCGKR
jgi:hypothetical protein